MSGRVFVVLHGAELLVIEENTIRPSVECARCLTPVQSSTLVRNGYGGWNLDFECHGEHEEQHIHWSELITNDIVVGPAFHPEQNTVRRRLEPRP